MKKTYYIIFSLITLVAISIQIYTGNQSIPTAKQEKVQGELMFKLISFGSLYGAPEPAIQQYEQFIDSLGKEENLPENYRMLLADHQLLKDHGVLHKPYFHLKVNSGKELTVWLNEAEYDKIKNFELDQLQKDNRKVKVSLAGQTIRDGMFKCSSIIKVNAESGTTFWKK